MSYFLTQNTLKKDGIIELSGPEVKHIVLSRRTKIGDTILLQDPTQARHACVVIASSKQKLVCTVGPQVNTPQELRCHITLGLALIAEQALDFGIQKTTELGVARIAIFKAENSPQSLKLEKLSRWQKIAQEAAKQCERPIIPTVEIVTFSELIADNTTPVFFADQSATNSLPDFKQELDRAAKITVLIGPEGGWTHSETNQIRNTAAQPIRLGPFTLRAETAATAAVAQLEPYA